MTAELTGKTVLLTGGARRVGAHVCRRLHEAGMNVALHYRRSEQEACALVAELNRRRPDSARAFQADLLRLDDIERLAREAAAAFGGLDALVNNASSFYPTPVGRATEAHWDDLVGSNLKAPFFLAQAAAPHLARARGAIVNIVDIHAERPLKSYPIYSAAKAGLVALTKSLARELGPEVRVNAIAPGTILWPEHALDDTVKREILARTPLKREGAPEDIARAVLFLVRDATYVTGQVLAVDGGRSVVL